MVQHEMILHNPIRLHARPAALLVAQAAKSKSNVTILFNDKMINAKSMFQVLGGGIGRGARIILSVDGEDEQATMKALRQLIENFPE